MAITRYEWSVKIVGTEKEKKRNSGKTRPKSFSRCASHEMLETSEIAGRHHRACNPGKSLVPAGLASIGVAVSSLILATVGVRLALESHRSLARS
ncbi:hypothetical protein PUN28_007105 [Cardiocondyla obscurior]|uniref:Uncharacterized protein n=1 Tax=Cardiocondyla obscurior TaxID=286306 RepID=A0AAW2G3P7_9HYME